MEIDDDIQVIYDSRAIIKTESASTSTSSIHHHHQMEIQQNSWENQGESASTSTSLTLMELHQQELREILRESASTTSTSSIHHHHQMELQQQESQENQEESSTYTSDSSSSDEEDDDNYPGEGEKICGICQEVIPSYRKLLTTSKCAQGHKFHETCITRWVLQKTKDNNGSAKCPMCRSNLSGRKSLIRLGNIFDYIKLREYVHKNKDGLPESLRSFLMIEIENMRELENSGLSFLIDFMENWPEPDANILGVKCGYLFNHFPDMKKEFENFVCAKHQCTLECLEDPCFFQGNY